MLNRRHIRIKVMQTLYANKSNTNDDTLNEEKFLNESLNSMYDLYLVILALLTEIGKKAKEKSERYQKKILATDSDKNPNTKFIDNSILKILSENQMLQNVLTKRKLNFWDLDFEYVDIVYKDILKSEVFKSYMNSEDSNFESDKRFIIKIYSDVIAPHDKLYDYFEDKRLTWVDDLPVVNTSLLKLLKKLKPTSSETFFLPDLYKDEDDKDFATKLFKKTLEKQNILTQEINAKTTNWDTERFASIDGVLLHMAVCEFQDFPSIPVKVTINEYLEIAKEYSTPKSSLFINGILDKIIKEYKAENKYAKKGRGLVQ